MSYIHHGTTYNELSDLVDQLDDELSNELTELEDGENVHG